MASHPQPIPRRWILDLIVPALVVLLIAAHVLALINYRKATAGWPAEEQGPLISRYGESATAYPREEQDVSVHLDYSRADPVRGPREARA